MRCLRTGMAITALLTSAPLFAQGQPGVYTPARPPAGTDFASVLALDQKADGVNLQLRNARKGDSKTWETVLYAEYKGSNGRSAFCTAALVGPAAVLTAAHCVPTDDTIRFSFGEKPHQADCTLHELWADKPLPARTDKSADWALCKVCGGAVKGPVGMRFETIDASTPIAQYEPRGSDRLSILLTGYGCTSDLTSQRGAGTGAFLIGENVVDATSRSTKRTRDALFYAPSEQNNLLTSNDARFANLCPGDSGGPVFMNGSNGSFTPGRRIVAVNSRVFFKPGSNDTLFDASLLSATGGPDFFAWADRWARRAPRTDVCGVTVASTSSPLCRSPS